MKSLSKHHFSDIHTVYFMHIMTINLPSFWALSQLFYTNDIVTMSGYVMAHIKLRLSLVEYMQE